MAHRKKLSLYLRRLGWLLIIMLCLLGAFIYFCIPGYSFSAYITFGIAGIVLCYQLLHLLAKGRPKTARVLRWILSCGLAVSMTAAVITGGAIYRAGLGSADTPCAYVIVLGAGVNGTTPSMSLRDRLNATYDYLIANPDTICIVSGGQGPGEEITEAACMYNDLTARGIDPARVWQEDQATDTRENIANSLALIEARTGTRPTEAGIVSSEYHLYRAGEFAKEQGLTSIGIPAETSWVSLRINYFLREIVAVWYYMIFGG